MFSNIFIPLFERPYYSRSCSRSGSENYYLFIFLDINVHHTDKRQLCGMLLIFCKEFLQVNPTRSVAFGVPLRKF